MKTTRSLIISLGFGFCVMVFAGVADAQVIIYNDFNFQGANMTISGNWNGTGGFDRNIKSIRVPPGYKVTIYRERNHRGVTSVLREDWSAPTGSPWINNIRSIRVEREAVVPSPESFPVIYAQTNYSGPAMAVERDWAGSRDWNGNPHRIRSIRVPPGWKLTLYEQANYRGAQTSVTSNVSWESGAYWNGRVRSIRVEKLGGTVPPMPGVGPVIYSQTNFSGTSMAIVRDWPGANDWDGKPNRVRSIRVPHGHPVMVYEKKNYKGRSYLVTSDWTPQPGDWWYGKIRSIRLNPGPQPR